MNDDRLDAGIHTDLSDESSYGGLLQLDKILDAQRELAGAHDEMLFIVIHQTTELWIKLMLHEVRAATACLRADDLPPAQKMMARVSRVQEQITQSWNVLSTLTPVDYLRFRDALGVASGFQSVQYRLLEFMLGQKQSAKIEPHKHDEGATAALQAALAAPSLYDEVQRLLARRGFDIDRAHLGRDLTRPYRADPSVEAAWLTVYRDSATHWELYELAEKLVDTEDAFQQWRFRHLETVKRIIGYKTGTGGSAGVAYLEKALNRDFFPELWAVRTKL